MLKKIAALYLIKISLHHNFPVPVHTELKQYLIIIFQFYGCSPESLWLNLINVIQSLYFSVKTKPAAVGKFPSG